MSDRATAPRTWTSMGNDYYRAGEPLDREGLFQVATDEVWKDGALDRGERKFLISLAHFLRIDPELARAIARRSKEKFTAGELGTPRPLDRRLLYERALFFAWSDGAFDALESTMLTALRRALRIPDDEHETMLAEIQSPEFVARTDIVHRPSTGRNPVDGIIVTGEHPPVPGPEAPEPPTVDPGSLPGFESGDRRPTPRAGGAPPDTLLDPIEASMIHEAPGDTSNLPGPDPAGTWPGGPRPGDRSAAAPPITPLSCGIRPEAIPFPRRLNRLCIASAGLVGLIGMAIIALIQSRTPGAPQRLAPYGLTACGAVAIYWGLRRQIEQRAVGSRTRVEIDQGGVRVPGALLLRRGVLQLPRDRIERIDLEVDPAGRPGAVILHSPATRSPIRLDLAALDVDPAALIQACTDLLDRPLSRVPRPAEFPGPQVLAGLLIAATLLAALVQLLGD